MKISMRLLMKSKKYWKYLAIAMVALVGITLSQLYAPWVVRELTRLITIGYPNLAERSITMGLTLLGVYAVQAVCTFLRMHYVHVAAWNFVADLRNELYDKMQELSLKFYHDKQTGDLMSRLISDAHYVELLIAHAAPDLIVNVMIFVSVSVMLFIINPVLAAICLATLPFMGLGSLFYSRVVLPRFQKRQAIMGALSGTLQDNLSGIREIQIFNQQKPESKKVGSLSHEFSAKNIEALRLNAIYHPFVQFVTFMGTVLVIVFGGYFAAGGTMPVEDIIAFVLYLGIFYQPITVMARANEDVQTALASAQRIFEVLDTEIDVKEKGNAVSIDRAQGKITFENVNFAYENGIQILKDINLKINPGEIVALVGPTGAGKTTLINLISRFYDPITGKIFLDDKNVANITLKSLRDNLTVVLQDVFLFSGTVAENIAYGHKNATIEEIINAAKTARAHEFVETFEEGYYTKIGERGVRLSGGQKQRISIARAVLRNTPILILDEATASVDVETEKLIHQAMDEVMENRTTILIAHRLSTVKRADKIVVLNHGSIEEMGTHDELLKNKGTYSKLVHIHGE
ncbi:MAG: ABC transporter ATP-binding protein/permease [Defluviitaleaceae bacterium]|nr:ABC transporter ATP-binding protein/permease [Defluviitaleaceae bacterium]